MLDNSQCIRVLIATTFVSFLKDIMENQRSESPIVALVEGLSLADLMSGGATFEVDLAYLQDVGSYDDDDDDTENPGCSEVDEDSYKGVESFEYLASKMVNVLDDGKIKKRIINEGDDGPENVTVKGMVTIHYNAYLEYKDMPFDSTYIRNESKTFHIDKGEVIPGLDLAVQTMKLHEKSQFLLHWDYGYLELGCPPRIPPKAKILLEIKVLSAHASE